MVVRTLAFMTVRQVARPHHTHTDRMVLAALARLLPRDHWPVFLVTPVDTAALAPGVGAPPLDLPGHRPTPPSRLGRRGDGRGGAAAGVGEPRWGYVRIVGNAASSA